jgi:DNA-binding MarR family transcriptional regulator
MRNTLRIMDDTGTPDPRPEIFGSLFVLVQHLGHRLDQALVPLGLTSRQWLLLAVLERWFPGHRPSLSEAAARYGTSRQNVKQIALGLERRGFLRLETDPSDRRTTRLVVTDKVGMFSEPELATQGRALLDAMFAGMEPSEILELQRLVVGWMTRLQAETAAGPDAVPAGDDLAGRGGLEEDRP